jgi:hypothetical protein
LYGGVCVVLALVAAASPSVSPAALAATHPIAGARAAASGSTWTVEPGGASSGLGLYFNLDDTTTGARNNCSAGMTLTFKTGSGLPGRDIASVSAASVGCCCGWKVTASKLPWTVNARHYNPATGTTTGTLTRLTVSFSGGGCHLTVGNPTTTSKVRISYTNSTGKLHLLAAGGNLRFFHVSGCPGIGNGDLATIAAGDLLTTPQTITSP